MTRHLTDEEFTAMVADLPVPGAARRHLEQCLGCRREVEALREAIDRRRGAALSGQPDWDRQHRRIMEALDAPPATVVPLRRRRIWRPLLAAAAGLVVAVGIWTTVRHRPSGPGTGAGAVPVERILAEVDATLSDDSVPGFEALEGFVPAPEDLERLMSDPAS